MAIRGIPVSSNMSDWSSVPPSLNGLGSLGDNVAMEQRSRDRGFQAALNGDFTSSLSQGMSRPGDDLLTEGLAEQGATVSGAPGLAPSPTPDFSSLNSLTPDQLLTHQGMSPTQLTAVLALKGLGPRQSRQRATLGTTGADSGSNY